MPMMIMRLAWHRIMGILEVVRLLLDYGAHVHAVDDYALRLASHNGISTLLDCYLRREQMFMPWMMRLSV